MTSIYMPSSISSGEGELTGQVYGKTSNTIISTAAVTNKQLTGLTAMTGAVVASDSILTGISKLSGNAGAATSNNVVNQIVKRDASGGFSAGTIKSTSLEVSGTTKITLPLKDSAGVNVLNIVNGNCSVGPNAMPNVTAANNIAIGAGVGAVNVTGAGNTLIGFNSASTANGLNFSLNTAVGHSTLLSVTEGGHNTAVGHAALNKITTGGYNTAIGKASGDLLTIGGYNTFIGASAAATVGTINNSTALGNGAQVDASNMIQLGNTSVSAVKTSGTLYALGLESIGTNSTLNIASANNTNTVNIGSGTAVQTINLGNSGTGATTIKLGGTTDTVQIGSRATCDNILSFGLLSKTKHIALFNTASMDPNNQDDQRFYGFGVNDGGVMVPMEAGVGWLRYQVPVNMQHRFYTGIDASTSNERFRLDGTGKVSLGNGGSLEALSGALTIGASTSTVNIGTSSAAQTINIGAGTGVTSVNIGNANDIVTFGNGCKLPTTGGAAATLNHYEEFTFSTALSGAAALPTNYISFIRIGSLVTMTVSTPISFTATATSTLVNSSAIPERFRPNGYEQCSHIEIQANGVNADGMARVSAAGNLTLGIAHFGSFTNGQPCQVYPFSMSWSVVS